MAASSLARKVFADASAAEFLAAAGSISSIPSLYGLPEVRPAHVLVLSVLS